MSSVENVKLIHELYKRLVEIYRDEVFYSPQKLLVDCMYHDFIQGNVHVLYQMIIIDIILVFLARNGDIAVRRVGRIGRHATRFPWTDEWYLGLEWVLLIAHGDAHAAMLPSY